MKSKFLRKVRNNNVWKQIESHNTGSKIKGLKISTNSSVITNLNYLRWKQIDISEAIIACLLEFKIISSVAMKQKLQWKRLVSQRQLACQHEFRSYPE